MFHTHPALVNAIRDDTYRRLDHRHGVPGDDFDGVIPKSVSTRSARRAQRRRDV
ncbi:MAG: hypothetical protein RJA49_2658 [Actinomycetota bacterium]